MYYVGLLMIGEWRMMYEVLGRKILYRLSWNYEKNMTRLPNEYVIFMGP